MTAAEIAVSLVEDDALVRGALARLIGRSDGFRCASQHASAEEALAELPTVRPDVVLMDINLPGMSGVECVVKLKECLPATQVVMLTVYEDTDVIFSALMAGATGYLLKQTPPDDLLAGIRDVHSGGSPMSSHIARKVVKLFHSGPAPAQNPDALSPRERAVLDLLTKGYHYKEISATLNISYHTVNTYIRRIYEKLHVHTRTEAVAKHLGEGRWPWSAPGSPTRHD
jgi:DNA-binding NarL/FixJ family response regulator